jgi:hypothetical protein
MSRLSELEAAWAMLTEMKAAYEASSVGLKMSIVPSDQEYPSFTWKEEVIAIPTAASEIMS